MHMHIAIDTEGEEEAEAEVAEEEVAEEVAEEEVAEEVAEAEAEAEEMDGGNAGGDGDGGANSYLLAASDGTDSSDDSDDGDDGLDPGRCNGGGEGEVDLLCWQLPARGLSLELRAQLRGGVAALQGGGGGGGGGGGLPRALRLSPSTVEFWAVPLAFVRGDETSRDDRSSGAYTPGAYTPDGTTPGSTTPGGTTPGGAPRASLGRLLTTGAEVCGVCGEDLYHAPLTMATLTTATPTMALLTMALLTTAGVRRGHATAARPPVAGGLNPNPCTLNLPVPPPLTLTLTLTLAPALRDHLWQAGALVPTLLDEWSWSPLAPPICLLRVCLEGGGAVVRRQPLST